MKAIAQYFPVVLYRSFLTFWISNFSSRCLSTKIYVLFDVPQLISVFLLYLEVKHFVLIFRLFKILNQNKN